MNNPTYKPPSYKGQAFNCPHCGAYAHQEWSPEGDIGTQQIIEIYIREIEMTDTRPEVKFFEIGHQFCICKCQNCEEICIWSNEKMIYPTITIAPMPSENMPDEIKKIYNEAAQVAAKSPRAAAALLRLALQYLCKHLGAEGKNIKEDIKFLQKEGLSEQLIKSMDAVRIIGNEAVHPGVISINDTPEITAMLFRLINFITEVMITHVKEMNEIYAKLPDSKKIVDNT